ncbi:MAG TPA: hypothetical protein VM843_02140 [Flavisolibacter sp.]|jgi:hypothetical protein|nr:hypothetical protein [Flavisolibacter sp.]
MHVIVLSYLWILLNITTSTKITALDRTANASTNHDPATVTLIKSKKLTVYTKDVSTLPVLRNGVKSIGIFPGDTVLLEGEYLYVQLRKLRGTKEKPIIFRNKGLVTIGGVPPYTLLLEGAHFKVLGDGDPSIKYGFKIGVRDVSSSILQLGNSTNTEVSNLEIYGGAIGVQSNADSGIIMYDNYWHHNYIHDLGNIKRSGGRSEAFYIGWTKGKGTALQVNCRIENNIIENITGDGIQVNNGSFIIKNNIIRNYATASLYGQRSAFVLGGNVKAKVYNNFVQTGLGGVLESFSDSADIRNNVFKDIDLTGTTVPDLIYINSKINDSSRPMWINMIGNTFENVRVNRKLITVSASDSAYDKGVFKNNKGLKREAVKIMPGDIFEGD